MQHMADRLVRIFPGTDHDGPSQPSRYQYARVLRTGGEAKDLVEIALHVEQGIAIACWKESANDIERG